MFISKNKICGDIIAKLRNVTQRDAFIAVKNVIDYIVPLFKLYILRVVIGILCDPFLTFSSKDAEDKLYNFLAYLLFSLLFLKNKIKKVGVGNGIKRCLDEKIMILLGFVIALVVNVFVKFLTYIPYINKLIIDYAETSSDYMSGVNSIFLLANILILSPMIEEYIFRSLMQTTLYSHYDKWKSIFITSIVFGVIHMENIVWGVLAFTFSLLLGFAYMKKGYFGSFCIHFGYNSLVLINYYINSIVSYVDNKETIFDILYIVYAILGGGMLILLINKSKLIYEFS